MGGSTYDDDTLPPGRKDVSAQLPPDLVRSIDQARLVGALSLRTLAESTGGRAIDNSNDYLGAVQRLATPAQNRYVLGFSPRDLAPDGKYHKLGLKLSKDSSNGFTIQARKGYQPQKNEGLTDATAKEIETAIFARDLVRDLPVQVRTEIAPGEGSGELTVNSEVDLKFLHYRKENARNAEDLTVVSAVFDKDGAFVAGKQQVLKLRLRDDTIAALEKQPPETLKASFGLSPGTYLVRVVARSESDRTMTTDTKEVEVR